MRRFLLLALAMLGPASLAAQDTTRSESGVRIGITYVPGSRPALAVLAPRGALMDSVRAILERDLDYSDRFEMASRPGAVTLDGRTLGGLAVDWAVGLLPAGEGIELRLVEARSGTERWRQALAPLPPGELRAAVHRAADAIVQVTTGEAGVAGTSLLFVRGGHLMRVDADGANLTALRAAGDPALSPALSRDGRFVAYTAFVPSGQPIVIQDLSSGRREVVPGTEFGLNITPAFSPDGRRLAYAHGTEAGTDIYLYQMAGGRQEGGGAITRITAGRFADNLSPTWSPDGSRIAFISNRAGTPQLYVMGADGTGQEVLAPFDFGATGQTQAPDWSPDGRMIAFHRDVAGSPQVFVLDVATRSLRQLTGSGRNEDPTWAPDSRHLAFVSSRSGARELWALDIETGRLRQLTTQGGARLPAWSPRGPAERRQ